MTIEDAIPLLDYHYWARDRMFDSVALLTPEQYTRDLGSSFRSVRDTVVHTYGAEWIWYSRWTGSSPTTAPDPNAFPDVQAIRDAWKLQGEKTKLFVGTAGDANLTRVFKYRTLAGQPAESVLWHMVQHIVNHATYHRGQVTTMLRQLGAPAPQSQDLISFYRDRIRVH